MMDEQLIEEVAHHSVIYNRQKYYLNGGSGGGSGGGAAKYETKDEAWQIIAMKLRTDVETCKKRWKYLRERYVSQRKQGDPPVYEHLSRPYLEKMKFLDQHIQPRKSYRNLPSYLTSPQSGNSSNYIDYNMDSKSNGSLKNMSHFAGAAAAQHHYHQQEQHPMNALSTAAAAASALENTNNSVKIEADQVFRDFAAAVASQQLQQMSQSQMHHQQAAAVAAAMADSSQGYQEHFRDVGITSGGSAVQNGVSNATGMHAASPVMKSPLASPLTGVNGAAVASNGAGHSNTTPQQLNSHASSNHLSTHGGGSSGAGAGGGFNETHNDELDCSTSSNYNKKPRVQLNTHVTNLTHTSSSNNNNNNGSNQVGTNSSSHFPDDTDDDSDDNSSTRILQPQTLLSENHVNHYNNTASTSTVAAAVMHRNNGNTGSNQNQSMFPSNADFLFQLYQQLPHQAQSQQQQQHHHQQQHQQQQQHYNKFQTPQAPAIQRTSEHLLGELVTTELLKMSKERRKVVQKRILEILFFDD